jgi:hypothetical protein
MSSIESHLAARADPSALLQGQPSPQLKQQQQADDAADDGTLPTAGRRALSTSVSEVRRSTHSERLPMMRQRASLDVQVRRRSRQILPSRCSDGRPSLFGCTALKWIAPPRAIIVDCSLQIGRKAAGSRMRRASQSNSLFVIGSVEGSDAAEEGDNTTAAATAPPPAAAAAAEPQPQASRPPPAQSASLTDAAAVNGKEASSLIAIPVLQEAPPGGGISSPQWGGGFDAHDDDAHDELSHAAGGGGGGGGGGAGGQMAMPVNASAFQNVDIQRGKRLKHMIQVRMGNRDCGL